MIRLLAVLLLGGCASLAPHPHPALVCGPVALGNGQSVLVCMDVDEAQKTQP